jgi:molecular chaperone GrpE
MSDGVSPEPADRAVEALPVEVADATPDPDELGIDLPGDPEAAVDMLLREVARARDDASTFLDDLKRVAADFDNYRKRTMKESASTLDRATERVVERIMPVLDTFDAAISFEPKTDGERQLLSGMINTREQLLRALQTEGLEVIPTVGEPFDPNVHEPAGAPPGSSNLVVSQELRRGYRLRGRVLRAALVVLEAGE